MSYREDTNAEYETCPRCGRATLRVDRPAMNALSRTDNETYICSECGTAEGLEDLARGMQHAESRRSKDGWKAPESAALKRRPQD